ncbi:MAG: hypothetical protein IT349_04785 [Candidatus Eisenbacteria bacterium]|nr:hypothetical protein [Candidatus Eisenbacteria bacterium]
MQPKPNQAPPAAAQPFLVIERTGGIVGWNERIAIDTIGAWTVSRRGTGERLLEGRYESEEFERLRTGLASLPDSAWGRFGAKGADYIEYTVQWTAPATSSKANPEPRVASGPWLAGRGGLPAEWQDLIRVVDPLLTRARSGQ